MAGIFSAVAAASEIISSVAAAKDNPKQALAEYEKLRKRLPALQTDGSITKFLSSFIVEPVIIVSKDARNIEVSDKLAVLNTDIFASFYLQAFHALTSMYDLDAKIAVHLLGTDNSSMFGVMVDEGMRFGLDTQSKDYFKELFDKPVNKYLTFSCEAKDDEYDILENTILNGDINKLNILLNCNDSQAEYAGQMLKQEIAGEYKRIHSKPPKDFSKVDDAINNVLKKRHDMLLKNRSKTQTHGYDKESFEKVCKILGIDPTQYVAGFGRYRDSASIDYTSSKVSDLQAENLYYVNHRDLSVKIDTIAKNGESRTLIVPITIKTHVIVTQFDNILNMLKPNDRTKKFGYRLDEYKSGAISLRELIFCGDLIKSYKNNKLKDKDGLISIIKQREESANSKLISTREMVGFEKYYNMLIVTADEKILLSKHVGGDILNEKYKQELMTQAHALTLSVIDPDYERVYILTKDIRGRSDVTFKAIARKSNKESDATDIMKAILANRPPVF